VNAEVAAVVVALAVAKEEAEVAEATADKDVKVEAEIAEAVAAVDVKAEAVLVVVSKISLEEVVMTVPEVQADLDAKAEAVIENVGLRSTNTNKKSRNLKIPAFLFA